jgi:PAS domain-containing protein
VAPVERLIDEWHGGGASTSENDAVDRNTLGVLPVRINRRALHGGSITCGRAVHDSRDRFSGDVALESGWGAHIDTLEDASYAANWSFLVHGEGGKIIGTLDIYLAEARQPSTDELDKLGQMARLLGIAVKRQQDEERLRSSEARYRGLFENVVDGVYIASREGEIITANPALVEMLGYESVVDLKAAGPSSIL